MKIAANIKTEVEVTDKELGRALMRKAWELAGEPDDAGCDWLTDNEGRTFIAGDDWQVSSNQKVAALIDAGNLLILGEILKI